MNSPLFQADFVHVRSTPTDKLVNERLDLFILPRVGEVVNFANQRVYKVVAVNWDYSSPSWLRVVIGLDDLTETEKQTLVVAR